MIEKSVDQAFTKKLKAFGLASIKLSTLGMYGSSGWPDRMILVPGGRPAFVELKAPGKKPTALQNKRIDQLSKLGYNVSWFDDAVKAMNFVMMCIKGASR